jgi:heptosyltransferase-2
MGVQSEKVPTLGEMKRFRKILVIQTAFIGDVILITPLIRAVRSMFPNATIDALVIPETREVLDNNPNLDGILTFDKRANKLLAFFRALAKIRRRKYDLAISPHSSTTTAYLMWLGGIGERLGFDRWHAARYLTMKVPHLDDVHKTVKNLHLLSALTDRRFEIQTELYPDEGAREKAERSVGERHFADRPTIAIAPGSVWNTKRWPEENYKRLAAELFEARFNLIFIGSRDERSLCERIISGSGAAAVNVAGQTSVLESAAVIGECDLLISNDSGALHIANAMRTDVFAFFGPTVRSIGYFPFRDRDHVFEVDMECRPCSSHGGNKCPLGHHLCMKNISPQSVFDKVMEHFGSREDSRRHSKEDSLNHSKAEG